jgi:hypothetical protein
MDTQILTSALDGRESSVSHHGRLNPTKISVKTKCIKKLDGLLNLNESGNKEGSSGHCQ